MAYTDIRSYPDEHICFRFEPHRFHQARKLGYHVLVSIGEVISGLILGKTDSHDLTVPIDSVRSMPNYFRPLLL